MLYSISGALYNRSSKLQKLVRSATRSIIQCQLECLLSVKPWQKQKSLQMSETYQQWRYVSDSWNHCSTITQKPKVQECLLSYN